MSTVERWRESERVGDHATLAVMGMDLPIIADLWDDWFLVAHPNGAAIAREKYLSVLSSSSTPEPVLDDDGNQTYDEYGDPIEETVIPERVRSQAVEKFQHIAWKLMRSTYWSEEKPEA